MKDDESRVEREERYRMYEFGRDLHNVAAGSGVGSSALWRAMEFLMGTIRWYRARLERIDWAWAADEELFDRAVTAASQDKIGETLASLHRMRELRAQTRAELAVFLDAYRKQVESSAKEAESE